MATTRQKIMEILSERECDARELSKLLHIREKDVYEHLSHISKSAEAKKLNFQIVPAKCLSCGYVFESRKRFTRPSRCPRCREERIEAPTYCII